MKSVRTPISLPSPTDGGSVLRFHPVSGLEVELDVPLFIKPSSELSYIIP